MKDFENLILELEGGIAQISVNRPKSLNALNSATLDELEGAFIRLESDESARCLILTGTGDKSFVAGADINELAEVDADQGRRLSQKGQRIFSQIENFPKPVIAAVNGFALGGGCELAMACHIRLASENARFGQPEVKLGLVPGYGGTQRLARLVGKGRAMEMVLAGSQIPAERAAEMGLVNRVVPRDDLLEECRKLAREIISNAPLAVRYSIEALNRGGEMPLGEAMDYESALFGLTCASQDKEEGTRAFLEKRKAEFKGR